MRRWRCSPPTASAAPPSTASPRRPGCRSRTSSTISAPRRRSTSRCWRTRWSSGWRRSPRSIPPAIRSRRSAATSTPSLRCRAGGRRPRGSSPTRSCTARRPSARSSKGPLKELVDREAAVISAWIAEGRLAPVEPRHLIMMIWAVTQHYADFDVQVRAVLGESARQRFKDAEATLSSVLLEGLRPRT